MEGMIGNTAICDQWNRPRMNRGKSALQLGWGRQSKFNLFAPTHRERQMRRMQEARDEGKARL